MTPKLIAWLIATRLLLGLCLLAPPAFAEAGLSPKTQELFAWFDKLGFEDTSQAKFVKIHRSEDVSDGFLLADDGPTFRAVLGDLSTGTFTKDGKGKMDPAYCGFEEMDLQAYVRDLLQKIRDGKDTSSRFSFDRMERSSHYFVLARECARRGWQPLAEDLLEAAQIHEGNLRWDLSRAMEWRAGVAFNDASKTWVDLAAGYRRIVEQCPDTESGFSAKAMVAKIERAIAEEPEYASLASKSLDGLSVSEQARILVLRLKEDNDPVLAACDNWSTPWAQPTRASNGAMEGLRKLGFAAVPALLAEMRGPERLSRSVYRSSGCVDAQVVHWSTQDLAENLLSEISGVHFLWFSDWDKKEGEWPQKSRAVEGWWRAHQAGNVNDWLVEVVRSGGSAAPHCAELLLAKAPESFPEAATAGFAAAVKSTGTGVSTQLLRIFANRRHPRIEAGLVEQLKSAPAYLDRLSIAWLLRHWGRREADEAIRVEWEQLVKRGLPDPRRIPLVHGIPGLSLPGEPEVIDGPEATDPVAILCYLVESESSARLVLDAWPKLAVEYRKKVISSLSDGNYHMQGRPPFPSNASQRVVFQELLLLALEDTTRYWTGDTGNVDPLRLCDIAGTELNKRWPEKFPFASKASKLERDRQRITIINASRRE